MLGIVLAAAAPESPPQATFTRDSGLSHEDGHRGLARRDAETRTTRTAVDEDLVLARPIRCHS